MKYQSLSMLLPLLVLPLLGAAVSAQTPEETAPPSQSYSQSQFDTIGVQHYDAGMMADLVTRQDAIVMVPPNFVIADNGPAVPPANSTAANSTAANSTAANALRQMIPGRTIACRMGYNESTRFAPTTPW